MSTLSSRMAWEAVRDALQERITEGRLPRHAPLPAERLLAEELGANRRTVRKALEDLVAAGVIAPRAPRGFVVTGNGAGNPLLRLVAVWTGALGGAERPAAGALAAVGAGVLDALREGGQHAMLLSPDRGDELAVLAQRPLGLLVAPVHGVGVERLAALVAAAHEHAVPVVVMGDEIDAPVDRVVPDHCAGAEALIAFLAARGCRRLAGIGIGGSGSAWYAERCRGAERACARLGLAPPRWVAVPEHPEGPGEAGFDLRARLFAGYLAPLLEGPEPVDALLAHNDVEAFRLARARRLLGRDEQSGPAIVGYDELWRLRTERDWEARPLLASVDKDNEIIGRSMAELLLARVAGELPDSPQRRLVAPRLVPAHASGETT
jgi:DNA-binding LacI/PurR family transcriptional regulator